jgi:hypothetical protein
LSRIGGLGLVAIASGLLAAPALGGVAAGPRGVDELTRVSCGGSFPLEALDNPKGAKREDHPSAAGLRRLIRHPGGIIPLRKRGWRLVKRNDRIARYLAGDGPRYESVTLERRRDPARPWDFSSSTYDCVPERVRGGLTPGHWRLAPASGDPAPGDTELEVLVHEHACASGRRPDGRVLAPSVSFRAGEVAVAYYVRPLRGVQTCPGAPPAKKTLHLSQPLGDRSLVDGGNLKEPVRFSP